MILNNDNIDKLLEERHRSNKFETVFGIEYDDVSQEDSINSDES